MRDRVLHLLYYAICGCVFGATSCVVMAAPAAALQSRLNLNGADDKSDGAGQYKLSGTVVDALTGAPIRRALVQLNGMKSQFIFTDEGGKFQFENLAQGQCGINAYKPGYTNPLGGSPTIVTVGEDTAPLVLKLDPESAITVKVTGDDGEGVEGLPVRVLSLQIQQGRRYWNPRGGGQTNEQGEFTAGNLHPGKYYVSVGPSIRPVGHIGDGARGADTGYPRVFYPNAADLEGAAAVEANAGTRARLEFTLSTVPLYRISVAVVGGTLGQQCHPRLTDNSGEDVAVGMRVDSATGVFRSGEVPAGFYVLMAECVVDQETVSAGRMRVQVDSNIANVTLPVAPTTSIPVYFRTNEGAADSNKNNLMAAVFLTEKQPGARPRGVRSQWEGDGDQKRAVIERVEPGTYLVDIRATPGFYVASARRGSVDLLTEELIVPDGGTTEAIEIMMRNDGAKVSGNVGGAAPANGRVLMISGRAPRLVSATGIVNGTFSIGDLAPGAYRALAIDRADDLEYTNPEVLRDYLTRAQEITLSPKQDARLDLELVQREK